MKLLEVIAAIATIISAFYVTWDHLPRRGRTATTPRRAPEDDFAARISAALSGGSAEKPKTGWWGYLVVAILLAVTLFLTVDNPTLKNVRNEVFYRDEFSISATRDVSPGQEIVLIPTPSTPAINSDVVLNTSRDRRGEGIHGRGQRVWYQLAHESTFSREM